MLIIFIVLASVIGFLLAFIMGQIKVGRLKSLLVQAETALHEIGQVKQNIEAELAQIKVDMQQKRDDNLVLSTQQKNQDSQLNRLEHELSLYKQKLEIRDNEVNGFKNKHAALESMLQSNEKESLRLHNDIELLQNNLAKLQEKSLSEQQALLKDNADKQAELSKLHKHIEQQEQNHKEKVLLLENAKQALTQQFENLANRIFEEKGEKFAKQNKDKLDEILQPFKSDIGEFKKKIEDVYVHEAKERASLQKEVNKLFSLNQEMNKEAQNLTKALKGDKKLQGDWGEVILERVLESSGLRKGHEYDVQTSLKDENDARMRPDVIVRLPDGKDIIIDAKVSLVSYEAYIRTESESEKAQLLKKHIDAIKQHIQQLSNKNYERLSGVNSLDFILMFMPIESAFVVAFQYDDGLFQEAFNKRIIIVTPTTLLATLGTIRNTWKYENLNKNAGEISQRAAKMLDKFRGFVEDIELIGKQIDKSKESYDAALNKLSKGRGNLVKQAEQLKIMGVQMKKELPQSILDQSETE